MIPFDMRVQNLANGLDLGPQHFLNVVLTASDVAETRVNVAQPGVIDQNPDEHDGPRQYRGQPHVQDFELRLYNHSNNYLAFAICANTASASASVNS